MIFLIFFVWQRYDCAVVLTRVPHVDDGDVAGICCQEK